VHGVERVQRPALARVFRVGVGEDRLGLVLRTPNSVQIIGLLILFPLTFTSNVFVDPQTMPNWLRAFVDANPVSQLVTAARGLINDTVTAGQIAWALVPAAALAAIFAPLALRLYEKER
jgi:ABC-2 type transport system permease protein